jgi:hypothetical protein
MTQTEIEYYAEVEPLAASTGHSLECFETIGEVQDIENMNEIAEFIRLEAAAGTLKCYCDDGEEH